MKTFEEYKSIVRSRLSEKRFRHTMGVVDAAEKLAECYGADVEKARLAGLLHDITKEDKYEQQLKYCDDFGIMFKYGERDIPPLLHAYTGAYYARNILNIDDEDIFSAIYYHTTGKYNMTLLEKVIYLADYIEDNRTFDGVENVRSIAFNGIDNAMITALGQGINEVIEKGSEIHIDTVECYNGLIKNRRENS